MVVFFLIARCNVAFVCWKDGPLFCILLRKPGLLVQGQLHGTVDIIAAFELTQADLENNRDKHQIEDLSIVSYERPWAWEVENPVKFSDPVRVLPPRNCRVWCKIELPKKAKNLETLFLQASDAAGPEMLLEIGKAAGVVDFGKCKKPYWRLHNADVGIIAKKFHYVSGDFESKHKVFLDSLKFLSSLAEVEDVVDCMQTWELRKWLEERNVSKTGSCETLRARVVKHWVSHELEPQKSAQQNQKGEAVVPPSIGNMSQKRQPQDADPSSKGDVPGGPLPKKAKSQKKQPQDAGPSSKGHAPGGPLSKKAKSEEKQPQDADPLSTGDAPDGQQPQDAGQSEADPFSSMGDAPGGPPPKKAKTGKLNCRFFALQLLRAANVLFSFAVPGILWPMPPRLCGQKTYIIYTLVLFYSQ